MDWALFVVLQVMFQPSLSDLFTVEAEKSVYEAEFGGDVVMGCRFQPRLSKNPTELKVAWHWMASTVREVYRMDSGKENLATQDSDFKGRVWLLKEELKEGWAKLQVSRLRVNDSGPYQCLVQTGDGADYKTITLSVKAPYKTVTKHIDKAAEGDEVLLSCQSEGYPASSVTWRDGQNSGRLLHSLDPETTTVLTPDQLFKVTSQIRVQTTDKNNYTCFFTEGGYSATFHIPDEMTVPDEKNNTLIILLCVGLITLGVVAVITYQRRKGFCNRNTRNLLVEGRGMPVPAAACLERSRENEEERIIFNEEETLGAFVKAHYSDINHGCEARRHWETFCEEELPHRLHNNKGQRVSLQALLPETGETLLLEGPPMSGKTTVAKILLCSWTDGPQNGLSNALDLHSLSLLVYVDCCQVKGDLFQEVTTQLPLMEKLSEDEFRLLTEAVLLVLDGYAEGNQLFDKSLGRFLNERGGCRVLVTARPGHCPRLRDTVERTAGMLELRTQTAKY